jgi:hypothetical protein
MANDLEVTYTVEAIEDDTPVRGNALASGDPADDKAVEDEILARLACGDVWAWATVTVRAEIGGFTGTDSLGCCSYEDEADFKADSSNFADLKSEALADLQERLAAAIEAGERAVKLYRDVAILRRG